MEEGYSPTYFALNSSDKADGGTGGVPKVHQHDFAGVVYGDNVYLVKELGRIADALERIAPYFEERTIEK